MIPNQGGGNFAQPTYSSGEGAAAIVLADLDRDGRLDLITASRDSSRISVRLGTGAGTFGARTSTPLGFVPGAIASGDLTAKVRTRFPQLTDQQMRGIFFRPMSGTFSQTGKTTFILAGINYQEGTLSDAKAIADYIQSVVRDAVAGRFGLAAPATTP